MSAVNPSRRPYRRFESLETEIVWAAVERLDIADQHNLLEALTEQLFVEPHLNTKAPSAREARAVTPAPGIIVPVPGLPQVLGGNAVSLSELLRSAVQGARLASKGLNV